MMRGKTLNELAAEVTRQTEAKADYITPASEIRFRVSDAVPAPNTVPALEVALGSLSPMAPGAVFQSQVATATGIPQAYWQKMRAEAPALLAQNANHWLERDTRGRMVRTLDNTARAYLSDSYRPLDNAELLEAILPAVFDLKLEVRSAEVTESRLYLQVTSPKLEGEVKVGDVVQAGFVLSNSEIGHGSLRLEELAYRLACRNGMIRGDVIRKYHVGGKAEGMLEDVAAYYRSSTRALSDAAFFAKVTDTVRHVLSPERFALTLASLQGAAATPIKPAEGVKLVAKALKLTEGEGASVLEHLVNGGDLSVWGMANAVTRLAHDAADYDRAIELEKLGGEVVELPRSAWREVGALAA